MKLNKWIASLGGDSTVVVAVTGDADVSLLSPSGSPRVLDEPVVSVLWVGTVSDEKDSVVELLGRAFLVILLLISFWKISVSLVISSNVLLVEVALHVTSLVWVRVLGINTVVVTNVLKGLVHKSSVASVVSVLGGAVDEILFGERDELSKLASVLSFECSGGGERPARSTHSLVLDIGDEMGVTPVDLIWDLESKSVVRVM
ncbi:hypothetical protein GCK72_020574 [Caenorhabditis remanei]|uniref:Uncharacterized protein n=1 Tax=Caenorhabditis remanei TaxID=31234 RepID=A0A6A5GH75_CAERE|nr:hypothetical protein GCK72_020574 [Caenorhabditis remanei]KAF1754016.1 hypothetical protein GCK72_020574 [Caenorhabditis remanei]